MRAVLPVVCLLWITGCGEKSPTGPTIPLNQRFTLAVGESAAVDEPRASLTFVAVVGDSRCPADAVCIQGGDALVRVQATGAGAGTSSYDLHTGDSSRASVVHGEIVVALVELQPFPFSSRTIAQSEYRATFTIARR